MLLTICQRTRSETGYKTCTCCSYYNALTEVAVLDSAEHTPEGNSSSIASKECPTLSRIRRLFKGAVRRVLQLSDSLKFTKGFLDPCTMDTELDRSNALLRSSHAIFLSWATRLYPKIFAALYTWQPQLNRRFAAPARIFARKFTN